MTIQELNSSLTTQLKSYIREQGYVDSGALVKSIKFKCREKANGGIDVKLNAQDYIQYLDNGKFLQDFFAQQNTIDIIAQYEADRITRDITIEIK